MPSFSAEENLERQGEELAVLESIYGDELLSNTWKYDVRRLEVRITADALLRISVTERYPSSEGPIFEVLGRDLSEELRGEVVRRLQLVHAEAEAEVVLFDCIELCKELFSSPLQSVQQTRDLNHEHEHENEHENEHEHERVNCSGAGSSPDAAAGVGGVLLGPDLHIFHGEPISDRKSVFQAHVCGVTSKSDVARALRQLLQDKKVQRAHHPCMYAYRICHAQQPAEEHEDNSAPSSSSAQQGAVLLADNDDDGEAGAGSKLAHLLDILHVENVLVMVSRWYGGVQLGPDRFKHIANVARAGLAECGFVGRLEPQQSGHKNRNKGKAKSCLGK